MEINADKYNITYRADEGTVKCDGLLLLKGWYEYEPIFQLLKGAALDQQSSNLTLDIRGLEFLNSSGISMMTKFIIHINDVEPVDLHLTVIGNKDIRWQTKLSHNLRRLMPALQTKLE